MASDAGSAAAGGPPADSDEKAVTFTQLADELKRMIDAVIEEELKDKQYDAQQTATWSGTISTKCIDSARRLAGESTQMKFVVNTTIFERGGGLHTTSACFWDSETDGCCSVRWESPHMHAIVVLFGLAL